MLSFGGLNLFYHRRFFLTAKAFLLPQHSWGGSLC